MTRSQTVLVVGKNKLPCYVDEIIIKINQPHEDIRIVATADSLKRTLELLIQ